MPFMKACNFNWLVALTSSLFSFFSLVFKYFQNNRKFFLQIIASPAAVLLNFQLQPAGSDSFFCSLGKLRCHVILLFQNNPQSFSILFPDKGQKHLLRFSLSVQPQDDIIFSLHKFLTFCRCTGSFCYASSAISTSYGRSRLRK